MTRVRAVGLVLLCLIPVLQAFGQSAAPASAREELRLRLTNAEGGVIEASHDQGGTWLTLGHVTHPALRVNRNSYTAAGWAQDSAVAATAVNALHVRLGTNPETGRPMTLSIVPGGKTVGAANREPSATLSTDLEGGSTIFGGGLGPYVNSPVFREREGTLEPLPVTYEPAVGDIWVIIRYAPLVPRYAVFENRVGGTITLDYGAGPRVVGVVDRAVSGIGRFEGAIYAAPGRVRANHPGVIDISTSPVGMMGGFQIIPRHHAQSPEMKFVATGHQWLVIGPASDAEADWAGQPPFFSGTILPSYRPDDIYGDHADWLQRVLSRTLVEVRYADGPWEPMPRIGFVALTGDNNEQASERGRRRLWTLPGELNPNRPQPKEAAALADQALAGFTHFRLVFPQAEFWP